MTSTNSVEAVTWADKVASALDKVSAFDRWINKIALGLLAAGAIFAFIAVCGRYIFNSPILGDLEIIEVLLVVVAFFACAHTQLRKRHVAVDMVINKVSPRVRAIMTFAHRSVSIAVLALVVWQTWGNAQYFMDIDVKTVVLGFPLYPFAFAITFGCLLLFIVLLRDLFSDIATLLRLRLGVGGWVVTGVIPVGFTILVALWAVGSWHVSPLLQGGLGMALMVALFFTAMPISFVLILVGFIGMANLKGLNPGLSLLGTVPYTNTANYIWAVLPFFMLMGMLVWKAGLSEDIYRTGYKWFGQYPGGICMGTLAASSGFAAVVGDNVTSTVTMGALGIPEMRRYKYDDGLASGAICAGGTLGPLIPPSLYFIIYGVLTEQSIGELFMAGIIPGILLATMFMGYVYLQCRIKPIMGPRGPVFSFKEKVGSLVFVWPILILFLLIIGGIYGGVFTPSEAGAIGAVGTLAIGLAMRRFTAIKIYDALLHTTVFVGQMFILLAGARMLGYFLTGTGLPLAMANLLAGLAVPSWVILWLLFIALIVIGCFMPATPAILICIPIFYPIAVTGLGYDPIWFGVALVVLHNVAGITPPYGINMFMLKVLFPEIDMGSIFKGVTPFVLVTVLFLIIITLFPQLAIWLPRVLRGA